MSDFPKLLGLNGTPMDVFLDKRNPNVEETLTLSEYFRYLIGNALEPVMHEIVALHLNAEAVVDKRMLQSTVTPYMLGNIDGLFRLRCDTVIGGVFFPAGAMLLFEGKTTNYFLFKDSQKGALPHHVAQCKAAMTLWGVDAAILVVIRGNDLEKDLVYHLVQVMDEEREAIPMIIHDFWGQHVEAGLPPNSVPGSCAEALKNQLIRYYNSRIVNTNPEPLPLSTSTYPIIRQSLEIRSEISELEAILTEKKRQRDDLDVYLIDHLKDRGSKAMLNYGMHSYTIGYQNTGKKEDVTSKNMARLKREMPDVYSMLVAEGIITQPNSKMFFVREQRRAISKSRQRVRRSA